MRQYLSSLVVVLLGVACGGTTDTGDQGVAGSSAGGTSSGGNTGSAGTNLGGSAAAGTAGKASAGSSSGGASTGGVGTAGAGGTIIIIGNGGTAGVGTGGSGVVDPKCPAHVPMGVCSADDVGIACQYDASSGCLCYPSAPGSYTLCQKVDPTCVYMTPAAAPAPPPEGTGGVTAKIALPPREVCTCVGSTWTCTFGI